MAHKHGLRALVLGAVAAAGALCASPSLAALKCTVESIRTAAPADATIVSATPTALPVPHCRVEGYITTTHPGPNRDNFRLQLPDKGWSGRYYFIGMGGAAGYVPSDSQIPAGNPMFKGFAVAGTDTGHTGHILDWGFLSKGGAPAYDHIDRAMHLTAVATQAITKAYYGVPKIYRYVSGCSGGGRMGHMSIERHPEDFDGVVLGASGRSAATFLKFIHAYDQMIREPGSWLSPAKLAMVDKKVTDACDMTDGAEDGVVWDHRLCHFDVATLKCKSGDAPDCLTVPEIKSIKAILAGPKGPRGEPLAEPMPITNVSVWSQFLGSVPPPWSPEASVANMPKSAAAYVISTSMARVYLGADYDVTRFNFKSQKDIDAWRAAARRVGYGVPYTADLRGLQKSGGKVILWNGRSDPCCSDIEMEGYDLNAAKSVGSRAALDQFARLYQVPGAGHCGGGTGPQDVPDRMLEQVIAWVEKGVKPGPVVVNRGTDTVKLLFADPKTAQVSGVLVPPPQGGSRQFLLCPYPQVSVFNTAFAGKPGAVFSASNWSCRTPKPGDKRQG